MHFPKLLIEFRPSKLDGVGVFAVRNIKRDEKVIIKFLDEEDFNNQIPWSEFEKLDDKLKKIVLAFGVGTPNGFVAPEDLNFNNMTIDWYFNHSCDGNLGFDEEGNFIAIRDINQDEELVYDYGLLESNPNFKMVCQCGSANCRKVINGNDWKNGAVDKKYMLPYLKKRLDQG